MGIRYCTEYAVLPRKDAAAMRIGEIFLPLSYEPLSHANQAETLRSSSFLSAQIALGTGTVGVACLLCVIPRRSCRLLTARAPVQPHVSEGGSEALGDEVWLANGRLKEAFPHAGAKLGQ